MKSCKELAKEIRPLLKAENIKASVRCDGNSIRIEVKSGSFKKAKEIAAKFEEIDRCPVTHEILLGGNTYVTVTASEELEDSFRNQIKEKLESFKDQLSTKGYARFDVGSKTLEFQTHPNCCRLFIFNLDKQFSVHNRGGDFYNLDAAISQALWAVISDS